MTSRMQQYRARMKAKGLMQVTVWCKPDDAEQIRGLASQLLDPEPPAADKVASHEIQLRPDDQVPTPEVPPAPANRAPSVEAAVNPDALKSDRSSITDGFGAAHASPQAAPQAIAAGDPVDRPGEGSSRAHDPSPADAVDVSAGSGKPARGEQSPTEVDVETGIDGAAFAEVAGEVANWDEELDLVDDLERHEEVLEELRSWLKECDASDTAMRGAIEQHINDRRKIVKKLKREAKKTARSVI